MKCVMQALRRLPLHDASGVTRHHGTVAQLVARASVSGCNAPLSSSPRPPRKRGSQAASPAAAAASLPPDVRAALFDLLTQRLCSPTTPLPARGVYDVLTHRSRIVEEFHFAKTPRRLSHQRVALTFLRRYNVLLHSLLFFVPQSQTWNTTPEFQRLALFGESILAAEVRGRLLKLFPDVSYPVLVQTLQHLVGEEGLCAAFDRFDMTAIVGAKPPHARQLRSITPEQKCHMLCAVIGEMYWFVARTRPTDRTHNNALFPPSDVLILHVLCSHLLECIPAELIYHVVEPVVGDVRRVWVNEPMSLPSQLRLVPRTIGALSLNALPLPRSSSLEKKPTPTTAAAHAEARSVRRALTPAPDTCFVKSYMQPRCNQRNFDRPQYQVLESDPVMEKCALSLTRQSAAGDVAAIGAVDDEAARTARAMELTKLALQS